MEAGFPGFPLQVRTSAGNEKCSHILGLHFSFSAEVRTYNGNPASVLGFSLKNA